MGERLVRPEHVNLPPGHTDPASLTAMHPKLPLLGALEAREGSGRDLVWALRDRGKRAVMNPDQERWLSQPWPTVIEAL